ncbi:MAG: transporter substrate-binding domain-containing protein [Cyanobacteria bacterium RI_101]|nr:transporter substrate-binding domain-containing protein [Cyanobacteria bacterium RI_101]
MKAPFWLGFLASLAGLAAPVYGQETILQHIQRTGLLRAAVREDAPPFGYRDVNGQWRGLCLDLLALIQTRLRRELPNSFIVPKLLTSTLFNRFDLVAEGDAVLECGANGIRSVPYPIEFSTPIFLTGTRLLIRAEDRFRWNPNGSLKDARIGFLWNTSNAEFIQRRYPQAQFQEFRGITGRKRGLQAVQQNKIDAFASDGILLLGEALLLDLPLGSEFIIVPREPLNCEEYGLILPQGDSQWKNLVNEIIESAEAQALYQKWFAEVGFLLDSTQKTCRPDVVTPAD